MQKECEKKINECIDLLTDEVTRILSDPNSDKFEKNLQIKPLSSKKKILTNAIASMRLVDQHRKKD